MINTSQELVQFAIMKMQENYNIGGLGGVPTGFTEIDKLISGLDSPSLNVIASRPGMGKTSFILSIAQNIAIDFNIPVAIFSLGNSSEQIIRRMITMKSGFSTEKLRKGKLEPHQWEILNSKTKDLSNAPLYIVDSTELSIQNLIIKAVKLVEENKVKVIFIDYIQLLNIGNTIRQNREEELSIIVKQLKFLSKKLNIPIVVTSQLSRQLETRGGSKRPYLNDIRDSGAIEDDADIVSFLYRPEYYGLTEWDDEERMPCDNQAELMILKNGIDGRIGNVRLKFEKQFSKFSNLDQDFGNEFISHMQSTKDAFDAPGNYDEDDVPF
jgi:replicative DNA helicase